MFERGLAVPDDGITRRLRGGSGFSDRLQHFDDKSECRFISGQIIQAKIVMLKRDGPASEGLKIMSRRRRNGRAPVAIFPQPLAAYSWVHIRGQARAVRNAAERCRPCNALLTSWRHPKPACKMRSGPWMAADQW